MNQITLTLGDLENDGHEKGESYVINSNLTVTEMESAYAIGAKQIGVDLISDVAEEDSVMSNTDFEKFEDAGFDTDADIEETDDGEGLILDPDTFMDLYLFTVKIGNASFEYSDVVEQEIYIGGYGLYED